MDVDALEQVLARHEVKLVRAADRVPEPDRPRPVAGAPRRLAELAVERNLFVVEDGVYADLRFEGERGRAAARARARPRDLRSTRCRRWWAAGCASAGSPRAARCCERLATLKLTSRLPHPHADPAHRGALAGARRATSATSRQTLPLLPRAPRRADGRAGAPPGRASTGPTSPHGRAPRVGHAHPAGRRARALLRGGAPRRDVHARAARSRPSAGRRRACGCRSRCSSPRSSTRACAGWRARCARSAARARAPVAAAPIS